MPPFEQLKKIKNEALVEIKKSEELAVLENLRVKYLGRRGELTMILRSLARLSEEEKIELGKVANQLKKELGELIDKKLGELKKVVLIEIGKEKIDVTKPGFSPARGALHPLTQVRMQIENIFGGMGFSVLEGPEVETEHYNFDALNIPPNHPARDLLDTFWLKPTNDKRQTTNDSRKSSVVSRKLLLRTHTSPIEVRYMEKHQPPFRIIAPGRVFRYEATDASHDIQFYQIEGLMVGKNVSIADFKGVIFEFFKKLFVKNISVRLRPCFFPFTEPSFEMDISCVKCGQRGLPAGRQGCSLCGNSGWLEIMGAGMTHPNVFKAVGYDPRDWQGFAFGLSLERVTMIKYAIDDIRLFYQNDLRFLEQF